MIPHSAEDLLKKGDRIAVSNITGREASKVSVISQQYNSSIVGGWALGKGGETIEASVNPIPVFSTFDEMISKLPKKKRPNKILIYSPPEAVYGDIKEVVLHGKDFVETIFIVTENVSIEVTSKIYNLCRESQITVLGCNTLGMINVPDHIRIGAVGGDTPEETFKPGSVTVISNSGNMVNTISSYLLSAGMGTSFGISTGKDQLILFPLKEILRLVENDGHTRIIVLYIEPGGLYEHEALEMIQSKGFNKPLVVYVSGEIAEKYNVSLGHAGAVIGEQGSSSYCKKKEFEEYFQIPAFNSTKQYKKTEELKEILKRGIMVQALHQIPRAVSLVVQTLGYSKDRSSTHKLRLNPWFVNLGELGKKLPHDLDVSAGTIPEPYRRQVKIQNKSFPDSMIRQNMRNASHASSNNGKLLQIYGYSITDLMEKYTFSSALILYWTGELPASSFEEKLVDLTLMASLTNGPGTISAQGAKLSASAGNNPNTAMIATLASLGLIHGGNGSKAVSYLLDQFEGIEIKDPFSSSAIVEKVASKAASAFCKIRNSAKLAGIEYDRIPCLGQPFNNKEAVNYDPREQIIYKYIKDRNKYLIFLDFYHSLAIKIKEKGCTKKVLTVYVDAAIACVWLSICWTRLKDKQMTRKRAVDLPFLAFALGRAAGGAGEYLDHQDFGEKMDMRIPARECRSLTRERSLPKDE